MLCCRCKRIDVPDDIEQAKAYQYIEDEEEDDSQHEWRICNACCTEIIHDEMLDCFMWEGDENG